MRRWLTLSAALFLAGPALAQGSPETLADIKAQISALAGQFNALKSELVSSGAAGTGAAGGDALQRLDAIEAELARLNGQAEQIELRLSRVVQEGTTQLEDLQFRVCELEEGCDVMALPELSLDGGAGPAPVVADPVTATADPGGPQLAMGEQADFDRAAEVLASGDFQGAATLFATFTQSYPGSPLTQAAQLRRGDALNSAGDTANAARSYLEAFSGAPDGALAGEALLKLGQGLGALGQVQDACVTLAEVGVRFPGSLDATNAQVSMQGLGCQ
ncbi:MAG: tol-pal system protein YbgF [Rhodobacteraceae bacterium]|jgi:tol-pal system protein YbgF|nr:tol-pal system protein YbgF [Paracoccaceae bacterium]